MKYTWKYCHQCGSDLQGGSQTCKKCGVAVYCACGAPVFPGMRYCGTCGVEIGITKVEGDWRRVKYDGRRLSEWTDDLVSHNGGERVKAAKVFEKLGAEADGAIEFLFEGMNTGERWQRLMPAESLLQIGKHVEQAAGVIVDAMRNDPSNDVRMTAFGSLCKNGYKAALAVPLLIETLEIKSDYKNVPAKAAEALGAIGPSARDAIPALEKAANSFDWDLKQAAEKALKQIKKITRKDDYLI